MSQNSQLSLGVLLFYDQDSRCSLYVYVLLIGGLETVCYQFYSVCERGGKRGSEGEGEGEGGGKQLSFKGIGQCRCRIKESN